MIKKLINKVINYVWDETLNWLGESPSEQPEMSDAQKIRDLQSQVKNLEERIDQLDGSDKKHGRIWS